MESMESSRTEVSRWAAAERYPPIRPLSSGKSFDRPESGEPGVLLSFLIGCSFRLMVLDDASPPPPDSSGGTAAVEAVASQAAVEVGDKVSYLWVQLEAVRAVTARSEWEAIATKALALRLRHNSLVGSR
jgi:hypothetical protein